MDIFGHQTNEIKKEVKEVKQVEWFNSRFYKIGDEFYPSVTTILGCLTDKGLLAWMQNLSKEEQEKIKYESSERGKRIHYACDRINNGFPVVYNPFLKPNFSYDEIREMGAVEMKYQEEYYQIIKYIQILDILKPKNIVSEQTVCCDTHKYAGTMDSLMYIQEGDYNIDGTKKIALKEGWYLIDIKSGNYLSDKFYYQTSAYAKAVNQNTDIDVTGTIIIHLAAKTKQGWTCKVRNREEYDVDFSNFLKIKAVFDITNTESPKVYNMPIITKWEK